jgi:hypothetical protein
VGTETSAPPTSTTPPRQAGQATRRTVPSQPAQARAVALARRADPGPRLRQLMGVCGWAAILGGVGLVLGLRALIGVFADDPPGWYEPSTIAAGLLGLVLTIGSFLTVRRAKAPWVLLSGASVSLAAAMVFTSMAF